MPTTDLEQRFQQCLERERLVEPGEPVLLGVSGGADSVALLHLFWALRDRPGWSNPLHVAHLDHQLRGEESARDAGFVARLCQSLNIPCTIESADIAEIARTRSLSLEQAGREARFELFERLCARHEISVVAIAHHADDNAETVLHRILRGTGLRGLGGIPPSRPLRPGAGIRLVRPLLGFRKSEIEAWLLEHRLSWQLDSSNTEPQHIRNRLRHQLIPLARTLINPRVEEALLRLAEQARAVDAYLAATGERLLESMIVEEDSQHIVLHCPLLSRKSPPIQTQLIRQALLRLGVAEGELTHAHLLAVVELAAGREGSKSLHLPAGLRVSRHYTRLNLSLSPEASKPPPPGAQVGVALEGETPLPDCGLRLIVDSIQADPHILETIRHRRERNPGEARYEEWIDADRVCPPLIARPRRPGDRFQPLGMSGLKKIADLLIDEKVQAGVRDRVVILCDQLGPIWVIPFRIDHRVRLTPGTRRILKLRVQPMSDG